MCVCVCVIRQSSDWLPLQCGAASFSELFVLWVASPVCLSVFMCVMREVWGVREEACSLPFCYQAVMEGLKQRSRLENSD